MKAKPEGHEVLCGNLAKKVKIHQKLPELWPFSKPADFLKPQRPFKKPLEVAD